MDPSRDHDKVLLMSRIIQEAPELFLLVTQVFDILDYEFRRAEEDPEGKQFKMFYYTHWKKAGDMLAKILDCNPICDEILEKLGTISIKEP